MNYNADEKGYYGEFGGAYIPEMLYPNVEELRQNYLKVMSEPSLFYRQRRMSRPGPASIQAMRDSFSAPEATLSFATIHRHHRNVQRRHKPG